MNHCPWSSYTLTFLVVSLNGKLWSLEDLTYLYTLAYSEEILFPRIYTYLYIKYCHTSESMNVIWITNCCI